MHSLLHFQQLLSAAIVEFFRKQGDFCEISSLVV